MALEFSEENDSLEVKVLKLSETDSKSQAQVQLSIPLPSIFKLVENHGLNSELFDDDLYSIKYKYQIILKVISQYLKKYVAISAVAEES